MALKPLTQTKEEFVNTTGSTSRKTLPLPRGPKVRKLSEDQATFFKGLFFGPTGSGKTRTILGLLLHGFKIFVISTDIGGEGLSTVKTELKRTGRTDLMDNVLSVVLDNYDEVKTFLDNPESIYPEIYDFAPDFIFWDGFTGFQQNSLADKIGDMTPSKSGDKEISDARESGLQFETQDWGMMRTGTVRNLDKFLKLHNRKSGQVWHKIVTCLEDIKPVKTGSGINTVTTYRDTREPMLQGSAKKLIGPAFDLIINTRIMDPEKESDKRSFKYVCVGHDTLAGAKTRGIELDPIEDGDMYKLWSKISESLGIKNGAVNNDVKVLTEAENSGTLDT